MRAKKLGYVQFHDGHKEYFSIVFPISTDIFIVVTKSGAYKYINASNWNLIQKYRMSGIRVDYFSSPPNYNYTDDCWVADPSVKYIAFYTKKIHKEIYGF